jgi:hypothetical protein
MYTRVPGTVPMLLNLVLNLAITTAVLQERVARKGDLCKRGLL